MTTCCANYLVRLRTKTIKGLNLTEPSCDQLKNQIVNFRSKSPKEANRILFQLLYAENTEDREEILNSFMFTASEKNMDQCDFLTNEQILILGNELRYQYCQSNPDYLVIEDNPNYQEELNTLKNAMSRHPLLLFRAVESCKHYSFDKEPMALCVNPLLSAKDTSKKEGLRNLGHNWAYQDLLLPYAKEIAHLLKAMYNAYMEEQKFMVSTEDQRAFPSPFAPLSVLLTKEQAVKESSGEPEISSSPSNKVHEDPNVCGLLREYSLSDDLSKFINNRSALVLNIPRSEEFWECLKQLRNLGIDLNLLIDREELLWPILNAHEKLDQATKALKKADEAFKEAQNSFSMCNMASIHRLSKAGKEHEDAIDQYNKAFDQFVEGCEAFKKAIKK